MDPRPAEPLRETPREPLREDETQRFRRVVECFDRAAALPPAERGAFLDSACGSDLAVRREVEAMLRAAEREDEVLRPGQGLEVFVRTRTEAEPPPPKLHGQYRILRVLGEGGMGIVYEAEQAMPRRTVALKAIRPGLASRAALLRFEHEAHVLGRLHHPGIAQIYEAGTALPERGIQAFIAMELVDGPPLVEHARARGLGVRERIELLVRVCDAVQHAHQRGVIHRDLKPSNILVDKSGQPRVLDFGVARLTDPEEEDGLGEGRATGPGLLVGTLAYMSPEQVSGDPAEVDARADVYALGVLLFELLTGVLPHPVKGRTLPDVALAIRNEPAPPLASFDRSLRGDLTAIAAMALEREKERRYASAADLAADLRRFLAGKPVAARRDATFYVLKRQFQRHRWIVAAVAAFLVGLSAFAVVAEVQRRRADANARALADALVRSHVERARLLASTGSLQAAEDLLWDAELSAPSARTHWALWDLYSRLPCLQTFVGPAGSILSMAATADGRWIATGSHETDVILWDAASGRSAALPGEHSGLVLGLAYDPSGARLYSADTNGKLVAWDSASRNPAWTLDLEGGGINGLACDAAGTTLAAACVDGRVRLVDVAVPRTTSAFEAHAGGARCVAFDGRGALVSAGNDGGVGIWDAASGTKLAELDAHAAQVATLAVDEKRALLATGASDGTIRLFDLEHRAPAGEIALDDGPVRCLRFAPDGARLLATGAKRIAVFDVATRERAGTGVETSAQAALFDPDGRSILAGGPSSPLRRWETGLGGFETLVDIHLGPRHLSGFGRDGRKLVTATEEGEVTMWEIPEATVLGKLRFGTGPIQVVTFDPETKRLLAIEKAGVVHVHDLATRREIWTRELGDGAVNGARISPDGTRIACARRDGTVEVLDAATGVSVARLDAGLGETQRVAFGPDSTTLASTHPDGKIGLWTLDGPRSIEKLEVPWEVFSVAFVRGTSLFAVGGWNGMLEVWDTATREPVATLAGHAQVVTSISSSPDGSLIVSGSFDGTVRLWDARTGEALRTFEPGGGIVHNVTIRADGNSIACACADGTFRVWDLRWCDRHIAGNREHQRARHAAQGQR